MQKLIKLEIHEKLCYYVDKRDLKNVDKLLNDGANPTKISNCGRSAIGQAAFKGFADVLELLLKSCEDETNTFKSSSPKKPRTLDFENEHTPDGMDGLQWDDEIQNESNSIVPADDEWSRLYMYYAKMFEQTGELLANTVKLKDPHCLDAYHQAPIHYAAVLDHVDCLEILLNNGSPVDICTQNGVTPLHLGIKNNSIIEILLRQKADPNRKIYNTGETALHVAAKMGSRNVIQNLITGGADINIINNKGQTPLMTAICNCNDDVAFYLITKNAKINLQDDQGFTAVYYSGIMNNIQITKILLDKGARPFITHYLLHICVENDFLDIAKLLIASGENVNIRNFSGYTPLYLAIKRCNAAMVDFLLSNGAQKFERDVVREIHVAVQNAENFEQFKQVTKVLLAHGLSLDDTNYWGETPVMTAIMLEQYKICDFLIKEGADVNKGCVASIINNFLLARTTSNLKLLKLLVAAGMKLHPIPDNLKPPPWENVDENFEDWLSFNCTNPQKLQTLCRISVRNELIKKFKLIPFDANSNSDSKMFQCIEKLHLPKPIANYLYKFDDLPRVF